MATTWITPDTDDVLARLSNPYYEEVETEALADGQTNPWTPILADLVEMFRGVIDTHFSISATEGTIPPSAKRHLVSLAIWDALTRFGLSHLLNDAREADMKAANAWLDKVAAKKVAIETPDDPTDATPSIAGGMQVADPANSTKRKYTRAKVHQVI